MIDAPSQSIDRFIGERIARRRLDYRIGVQDLADAVGVPVDMVTGYESGRVPVPAALLVLIAHELQMPLGWFIPDVADLDRS